MFVSDDLREVRDLHARLGSFVARVDPDATLASDATKLLQELASMARLVDAATILLTPRAEADEPWRRAGYASLADWLAALEGTSKSDAQDRVKASKRIRRLPRTKARLREGKLSKRQAQEVADGATADPHAEERLLDAAERDSLPELRDKVQRTKAAADPDPDATRARHHRDRYVRSWRDQDGALCFSVRGATDTGAEILAAVITNGVDVHTVAHLGRRFTAHQRTALQWTHPVCAREGCGRTVGLEYDHRTNWSDTHRSVASDADRLCDHDHDLKTRHGWALVEGSGVRPMVPPHDPRHPRNHGTGGAHAPPTDPRLDHAGTPRLRLQRRRVVLVADRHGLVVVRIGPSLLARRAEHGFHRVRSHHHRNEDERDDDPEPHHEPISQRPTSHASPYRS